MTDYDLEQYGPGSSPYAIKPLALGRLERALAAFKPQPSEGGSLKERKVTQLNGLLTAAELLTKQIEKVSTQIATLSRFPDEDPYVDGTQLRFKRNFPGGDQVYTYGAIRANDVWYTTGARGLNGVTWGALVNWLGLGLVGDIEVVYNPIEAPKVKAPARRARVTKATTRGYANQE
jgi:hypothetical protein